MSVVLAFDTATSATVAAVLTPGGEVVERRDDPEPGARPRHAQTLLALCEAALEACDASWGDVTRVGAGIGPGTFTGLRIGVASARALAGATGAEVVAVSSLEVLAHGARTSADPARQILAVIDARRGEAFAALYPGDGPGGRPAAHAPESLARMGAPQRLAVGDGALRFRAALEAAGAEVPPDGDPRHLIGGAPLVRLAATASPIPAATLVPDYVRLPDAELHRRRVAAGP